MLAAGHAEVAATVTSQKGPLVPSPTYHEVESGDTLIGIAIQYGVTKNWMRAWNPLLKGDQIKVGWRLIVPDPPSTQRLVDAVNGLDSRVSATETVIDTVLPPIEES